MQKISWYKCVQLKNLQHPVANKPAMKKLLFTALVLMALSALAFFKTQSYLITGKVTDEKGKPVAGASVVSRGTEERTVTDTAGNFILKIESKKATLLISSVGMVTQQLKVSSSKNFTIALQPIDSALQEVVVVGYSTRKKMNVTGATASISADQLLAGRSETLYGSVSGLAVNAPTDYGNGERDDYEGEEKSSGWNREGYDHITENRFQKVTDHPLSTFSIDVDAASYSNVRRFLQNGNLPPAGAVRIEELINYFKYDYPQPTGDAPFSINTEAGECPWNPTHQLMLIGLQGKSIPTESLPASNLVFLIDVSGSMDEPDKLPLVKASLKLLTNQLREQDRVSLVVYAGAAGTVLPPTSGANKTTIIDAIDNLSAGGSTAGGEGIMLAYKTATKNFIKGGNNRVILCTDGDFNMGQSSDDELETLIEKERETGVFLSIAGFGTGNYQDAKMQKLADKGNGNHSYIDNISEARKVFVSEFGGTLFTIAKDVKLQIEFNPARVQGYRLIGYENRMLNKEDFNNDKKDAGELGSGHTVTALYEIIPTGISDTLLESVDALKYQQPPVKSNGSNELMTVKFRYKEPSGSTSKLLVQVVNGNGAGLQERSDNFRFAAAVAEFGLLLRHSDYRQQASWKNVLQLAKSAVGKDAEGYRSEFIRLINDAASVAKTKNKETGASLSRR